MEIQDIEAYSNLENVWSMEQGLEQFSTDHPLRQFLSWSSDVRLKSSSTSPTYLELKNLSRLVEKIPPNPQNKIYLANCHFVSLITSTMERRINKWNLCFLSTFFFFLLLLCSTSCNGRGEKREKKSWIWKAKKVFARRQKTEKKSADTHFCVKLKWSFVQRGWFFFLIRKLCNFGLLKRQERADAWHNFFSLSTVPNSLTESLACSLVRRKLIE